MRFDDDQGWTRANKYKILHKVKADLDETGASLDAASTIAFCYMARARLLQSSLSVA